METPHGAALRPGEQFCCQNEDCADCGKRGQGNLTFRGYGGHQKAIRMIHCKTCKRVFSERKGTALERCRLPQEKALSVLAHIREGNGTRQTARLVGVHRDSVTRLLRVAGIHSATLHEELVEFSPRNQGSPTGREVDVCEQKASAL